MESVLVWIFLLFYIRWVNGQCDISNCIQNDANPLFSSCSDYIQTLDCMRRQYNGCTGQAGRSEVMLSVRALNQPSDCAMDIGNMARSMTARSSMVNSMVRKSPPGTLPPGVMSFTMPANPLFPMPNAAASPLIPAANMTIPGLGPGGTPGMMPGATPGMMPGVRPGMMPMFPGMMGMGDDIGEMEMELPEAGEGISEMWEDMMESGMMPGMSMPGMAMPGMSMPGMPMPGMAMPGMMGAGMGGSEGMESLPGSTPPGHAGGGKGPRKSKFVYYGNSGASNKLKAVQMVLATLPIICLKFL